MSSTPGRNSHNWVLYPQGNMLEKIIIFTAALQATKLISFAKIIPS
jgi:hypothetical protein